MRKTNSILLSVIVVVLSFVIGCGGDDSTAPEDNTPATFSKMMGHGGSDMDVAGVVVMSDGLSVVVGTGSALDITGSSTPLDGAGASGVFLAGLRPDGSIGFRTFVAGSGFPILFALARDPNDNLLVTGSFTHNLTFGTTNLSANATDILIAKLDAAGHPIWAQSAGGINIDEGLDIAAGADGSVYECGRVTGEVAVAGEDTGVSGKTSGYLVKLRSDGNGVWQQTAAPAATSTCTGVTVSHDGSVLVCGSYVGANIEIGGVILPNDGAINGFIARFDADGTPAGNIRIGGTGAAIPLKLTTINDEVVVAGVFSGTADFDVNTPAGVVAAVDNDAFVARYSKSGQLRWVKTFGTTGDQTALDLTRTSSGDVLVNGKFDGTFSTGSTVFTAVGVADIFVVRLSGSGQLLSAQRVRGSGEQTPSGIASFNDGLILTGKTNSAEVTFPDGTKRTPFGTEDGFIYQQP